MNKRVCCEKCSENLNLPGLIVITTDETRHCRCPKCDYRQSVYSVEMVNQFTLCAKILKDNMKGLPKLDQETYAIINTIKDNNNTDLRGILHS